MAKRKILKGWYVEIIIALYETYEGKCSLRNKQRQKIRRTVEMYIFEIYKIHEINIFIS